MSTLFQLESYRVLIILTVIVVYLRAMQNEIYNTEKLH